MKKLHFILLLAGCLLLCCCQRTKPQAPSNKATPADTTRLALLQLNQRMAEEADRALAQYITRQEENYTLDSYGFWYRRTTRTDRPRLQKGQTITVSAKISDMQEHLFTDTEEAVCIGKKQVIPAIEQMLPLLREGETCIILAPWYAAFGSAGNNAVPPYTNVKIELQTNNYN